MAPLRVERLREQIRDEIAAILQREVKDPRVGFASVTQVELSRDLRHATVFVSVLGTQEEKALTMATLERAAGFIRTALAHRLRLKHNPDLTFRLDSSIEGGGRVMRLLRDVSPEEQRHEPGAGDRRQPADEP